MARLQQLSEPMRTHIAQLPCPQFDTTPWAAGSKPGEQRIAILSTAGLHKRNDRPFQGLEGDYRIIPGNTMAKELVMTHVSTNFDRTGFQQDWTVAILLIGTGTER